MSSPRTRRSSSATPCGLPHDMLMSYQISQEEELTCYVAAELDSIKEVYFVVGDNKTYGGYLNAPLVTGKTYDVWVGTVLTVDGVTAASYSKTAAPVVVSQYMDAQESRADTIMIASTGVAVLIAIILIIIIVAIIIARR